MKFKNEILPLWAAVALALAIVLLASPRRLLAQNLPASLTSDQQSAAKSALCSAVASKFPNPAAAGPSALTDPSVLAAAAPSFASSTKLPLPSATDMLKTYAMQHATDILGSCAASGLPSQIPGAGGAIPSMPKLP